MDKEDTYIKLAKMIETRDKDVDKFVSLFAEIDKSRKDGVDFYFWMKKNCLVLYLFFIICQRLYDGTPTPFKSKEAFYISIETIYTSFVIDRRITGLEKMMKRNGSIN